MSKKLNRNTKRKTHKKTIKKAGCGCKNSFLFGGRRCSLKKQRGGYVDLPSWTNGVIPQSAYYPFNINNGGINDPISPSNVIDTRLLPNMTSGGKKHRNRTHSKNLGKRLRRGRKTMKGGIADFLPNDLALPNTTAGAVNSYNILNGGLLPTVVEPNPGVFTNQGTNPLGSMYSKEDNPLV